MQKYFLHFLFVFILGFTFGQNNISPQVYNLYSIKLDNTTAALKNGEDMLRLSQTPQDSLLSHLVIGDLKDKRLEYTKAIEHYQKAAEISATLNDYNNIVKANTLLALTYWNAGIKSKYEKAWSEVLKYAEKSSNFNSFDYQHKMWLLEGEGQFCEATNYAEKNVGVLLQLADFTNTENYIQLAAFQSAHAYYLLKCDNSESRDKGRQIVKQIENLVNRYSTFDSFYYAQKYFMCKAIISHQDHDSKSTLYWFKKALDVSIYHENFRLMSSIMDDSESLGIQDSDLQYAHKFLDLLNKKTKEIAKISNVEIDVKQKEIDAERKVKNYIKILVLLIIIVASALLYKVNTSKLKAKKRFLEIITELKNEKDRRENEETLSSAREKNTDHKKNDIQSEAFQANKKVMSEEKESELVKKLISFEKGKEYRDKNFTISNMASLFDTNTRYLNYIISKHRGMAFNDYINHLRIKHLINKLYDDSNFLNYKISYLSEYCGFSSHSRFTQIFKKELGISPSDFISNLKKIQS